MVLIKYFMVLNFKVKVYAIIHRKLKIVMKVNFQIIYCFIHLNLFVIDLKLLVN